MTASKKLFSLILGVFLALGSCFVVNAEETKPTQTSLPEETQTRVWGDFSYEVYDDNILCLTEYHGEGGDVVIPDTIDGIPVATLGSELFWSMEEITSVTLPESLEYIGARVFQNCTSLTSIKIPDSVHEIGDSCFLGCSKLKDINIPAELVYVGAFAFDDTPWVTQFDGCTSIILGGRIFYKYLADEDMVVVPDGVVCLSDNAFENKSLSFVSIPESVVFIGDYCFYNCKNLKEICLGKGIYHIGENSIGVLQGVSEVVPVEGFTIYADEKTLGAEYAETYSVILKPVKDFKTPENLPEAEACQPTVEIRDVEPQAQGNPAGLSQGGVVAVVLSIAGCVIVVGGLAVASHIYEKKRKLNKKNSKKKK